MIESFAAKKKVALYPVVVLRFMYYFGVKKAKFSCLVLEGCIWVTGNFCGFPNKSVFSSIYFATASKK